jgi:hypothetical protein
MSIYKEASKLKLRFSTEKGLLSVEQLWDLSQSQLSTAIKAVKKILVKDNDDELSFLETNIVVDTENQLRFDILKDIYMSKKDEADKIRNIASVKAHNRRIDELIAMKQESELQNMSIAELERLRK